MTEVLLFLASGYVVVRAGVALARHADVIADATGLGRVWIGSVLLAAATSLPEAATDVSAVLFEAPNLAAGDLFGSCLANMLILGVVDLIDRDRRVLRNVALDHGLSASLAIVLTALATLFVVTGSSHTTAGVGTASLSLLVVYLAGARAVYRHNVREPAATFRPPRGETKASVLRRALRGFGGAAAAILVAAPFFAWSAGKIAELTGLGPTFFGTLLVGVSTSLPELVVALAAVRAGAIDLAVGNVFGSNALNIALFFLLDLAVPGQSFFAVLDPGHAVTGILAVAMTGLGLAAVFYRAERRFRVVEPDSALLVLSYFACIAILYTQV